ncbi:MAG: phage Tail Collar domain protein [Acidobacteria bacterium]|nr:phage Tail Collar domain protein [Acidobacteriota bacterium]
MSQPYVGEIRMFGGNFAPAGWAFCQGQLMPISENDVLFQLIGTTYGGDGQETFALPDLQGRVPIHQGQGSGLQNYQIGEQGGSESVTLTTQTIPAHSHPALCIGGGGNASNPAGGLWAGSDVNQYAAVAPDTTMGSPPIPTSPTGGSQPHENMIPFTCISYILSLFGIFPSQN